MSSARARIVERRRRRRRREESPSRPQRRRASIRRSPAAIAYSPSTARAPDLYCRLLPTCRMGVYERSPPTPVSLPPTVYPRATVSHRDLSTAVSRSFLYRFSAFILRSLLLDNLFTPICIKTGSRCYVVVVALALRVRRPCPTRPAPNTAQLPANLVHWPRDIHPVVKYKEANGKE